RHAPMRGARDASPGRHGSLCARRSARREVVRALRNASSDPRNRAIAGRGPSVDARDHGRDGFEVSGDGLAPSLPRPEISRAARRVARARPEESGDLAEGFRDGGALSHDGPVEPGDGRVTSRRLASRWRTLRDRSRVRALRQLLDWTSWGTPADGAAVSLVDREDAPGARGDRLDRRR